MADNAQVAALFNVYKELMDAWHCEEWRQEIKSGEKMVLSVQWYGERKVRVPPHYQIVAGDWLDRQGYDIGSNKASQLILERIAYILDSKLWRDDDPVFLSVMHRRCRTEVYGGFVAARPEGDDPVDYFVADSQEELNQRLRLDALDVITWGQVLRGVVPFFKNPTGAFVF